MKTLGSEVAGVANVVEMAREVSRLFHESGQYPKVEEIQGASVAEVMIHNEPYANFASNSFLGLCDHPKIIETMIAALHKSGTGAGSARLIVSHSVHRELEERIAAFKGREDAVVFSTGMLANLGVIPALASSPLRHLATMSASKERAESIFRNTTLFLDNWSHSCIQDGAALSAKNLWGGTAKIKLYGHMDMERLEHRLASDESEFKIIMTDGVFSIHGHLAPLPRIVELAHRFGAVVYVDDAHGTGVLGQNGRGTAEELGCDQDIDIPVGTFSKAFGGAGGFVVGSREFCDYTRVAARTAVFNTAMPPANAAGLIKAIDIAESEPWRRVQLLENAGIVRTELERLGFSTCDSRHHIVPVFIGDDMLAKAVHAELIELGVFTGCAPYPATPFGGNAVIRCNMMATHAPEHLERLVNALEKSGRRHGIIQ